MQSFSRKLLTAPRVLNNTTVRRLSDNVAFKPVVYPGSRLMLFNETYQGNRISSKYNRELNDNLKTFENSEAVAIVYFSSGNEDVFSTGINTPDYLRAFTSKKNGNTSTGGTCRYLQKNAHYIKNYKKPTIAMYMGSSTGSPFGLYSGCTYKLASPSATLTIDELSRNQLPLGGLAHHFIHGYGGSANNNKNITTNPLGCSLLRYLAITKRALGGEDMLSLGLVSHLVSEHPYDSLSHGISQTYNNINMELIKSHYTNPVDLSYLQELLSDMDIRDPASGNASGDSVEDGIVGDRFASRPAYDNDDEDIVLGGSSVAGAHADSGTKDETEGGEEERKPVDWDVFNHKVWQQASIVPEVTLTESDIHHMAHGEAGHTALPTTASPVAAHSTDPHAPTTTTTTAYFNEEVELRSLLQVIDLCFNNITNTTVQESVKTLTSIVQGTHDIMTTNNSVGHRDMMKSWAQWVLEDCLANKQHIPDMDTLQMWYNLTDIATVASYEDMLKYEYNANMHLIHNQLFKTPIDMKNALKKLPATPATSSMVPSVFNDNADNNNDMNIVSKKLTL